MNRLLVDAFKRHAARTAIVEAGVPHTYQSLLLRSEHIQRSLRRLGVKRGERVALFGEKTANFCATQLAVWQLGAISLVLLPSYPAAELKYFLSDSGAKLVVATDVSKAKDAASSAAGSHPQVVTPNSLLLESSSSSEEEEDASTPAVGINSDSDAACLVYTSGSTGPPKGVVTTHGSLKSMIAGMQQEWKWTKDDFILHFLPLHHVHGFVNKLLTPLATGAKVEFVDFAPHAIWERFSSSSSSSPTVFMGVPTIYAKLLSERPSDAAGIKPDGVRLFVSGSAPLPVHLFRAFEQATGQRILERWGMTEVGMGLSNPLVPASKRVPGFVGLPMPGIEVKICDLPSLDELPAGTPGDLLVRGSTVFSQYWKSDKARDEFVHPGAYFVTGDVAVFDAQVGAYKIVGRKSVDVIKSSGYKISALDIEQVLMGFPHMREVAVLGLPDEVYGEVVAAIVVVEHGGGDSLTHDVQEFAAKHLAKYKVPRRVLQVGEIPKNAMGKVNKKALRQLFAV